jgi:type IV pilus assembly protein PilA
MKKRGIIMREMIQKRIGNKKGFTLIELIVVIAIIAILAAVLVPRFAGFTDDARHKAALTDGSNLLMALSTLDAQGNWPADVAAAQTAINNLLGTKLVTATGAAAPTAALPVTLTSFSKDTDGITFSMQRYASASKTYTVTCTDGVVSAT